MPKPYKDGKQKQKRMMRKFTINEISLVGRPAQEGAMAVIMKRRDSDPGAGGQTVTKKAQQTGGAVEKGKVTTQVHYQTESRETRVTESDGMPVNQGGYAMGKETDTKKKGAPETGNGNGTGQEGQPLEERLANMEKEMNTLKERNAQLEKDKERAQKEDALSENERAHYDGLDDTTKEVFLAMNGDARGGEIQKAAEVNAVVHTGLDGTVYRKSDDPKTVALAKQNDTMFKKLETIEAEKAADALKVRAEKELAHLPGSVEHRAAMLKAIEAIEDEETRKAAMAALKANNDRVAKAFDTVGHTETDDDDDALSSEDQIDKLAKNLAEAEKIPYVKAYEKVVNSPEGTALYNKSIGRNKATATAA